MNAVWFTKLLKDAVSEIDYTVQTFREIQTTHGGHNIAPSCEVCMVRTKTHLRLARLFIDGALDEIDRLP